MSTEPREGVFEDKLRQVSAELESEGWVVLSQPSGPDLPPSLRDARFDLLARRGDDIVVFEIASRSSAPIDRLDLLAKQVSEIPNARLEVLWIGDTVTEPPDPELIERYVQEARTAAEASAYAALLMAVIAIEAAAIQMAASRGIRYAWTTPWQAVSLLFSLGRISESDFALLSHARDKRNAIAHFNRVQPPVRADVEEVLDIADHMAHGRYVSAAEMVEWFLENFENPANKVPYDAAKGGYQYQGDGPYEADDILQAEFPQATARTLAEAVSALDEISKVWALRRRGGNRKGKRKAR